MTATATANATAAGSSAARPPHLFWTLAEGRALVELGAFYAFRGPLSLLPRGDGHSVLVLPGFLASDRSTKPMRDLLNSLGYDAHGWDMGRNIRIDNAREAQMNELLDRIHASSGRKVSIIGWSLGGVFAREIAKNAPDKVRQVISLGSPISNDRGHTNARRLFERLNGPEPEPVQAGRFRNLDERRRSRPPRSSARPTALSPGADRCRNRVRRRITSRCSPAIAASASTRW